MRITETIKTSSDSTTNPNQKIFYSETYRVLMFSKYVPNVYTKAVIVANDMKMYFYRGQNCIGVRPVVSISVRTQTLGKID